MCRPLDLKRTALLLLLLVVFFRASLQAEISGNRYVDAEIVTDVVSFQPRSAEANRVGILFTIEPGWHIYWEHSGEAAIPTKIEWELPPGWNVGKLQWPAPIRFLEKGDITTYGYQKSVLLFAEVFPPDAPFEGQKEVVLKAQVSWLACKDVCIPGRTELSRSFTFSSDLPLEPSEHLETFEKFASTTPVAPDDVSISGLASTKSIEPGSRFEGALIVGGLAEAALEQPAAALQFFPRNNEGFQFNSPMVAISNSSEHPGQLVVSFSVDTTPQIDLKKHELSGIVVLAADAHPGGKETALNWSFPVEIGPPSGTASQFAEMTSSLQIAVPLDEFRYHSFVDETEVLPTVGAQALAPSGISLWQAVLFAFIGGLLLNFMPCVLPILGIKVLGVIEQRKSSRREIAISSVAYSGGILFSMLLLAVFVIALQAFGTSLGWGFQFQHPWFVIVLLCVVFFLSLSFFDAYVINLPFISQGAQLGDQLAPGPAKHFFDGILAVALSTPCTAPFLGAALAFAFAQPWTGVLAIFFSVGLGLAAPYVILTNSPRCMRLFPRPGGWMHKFKQLLGFFLLATAVWLLFVLHTLVGAGALWTLVGLLGLCFIFWLRNTVISSVEGRPTLRAIAEILLIGAGIAIFLYSVSDLEQNVASVNAPKSSGQIAWQNFDERTIEEWANAGKPVFIDFTADWCITCKYNENFVIETAPVAQAIEQLGIVAVKADWTNGDKEITAALKRYGAGGVPYYVLLPADGGEPHILPVLLRQSSLLAALHNVSQTMPNKD